MPSSLVDPAFSDWLRSPALFIAQEPAAPAAIVATGVETEVISPLADATAAQAEGVRQLALLGGGRPLAQDEHVVPGLQSSLLGLVVTIKSSLYPSGQAVGLVIAAEEEDEGSTRLEVVVPWQA